MSNSSAPEVSVLASPTCTTVTGTCGNLLLVSARRRSLITPETLPSVNIAMEAEHGRDDPSQGCGHLGRAQIGIDGSAIYQIGLELSVEGLIHGESGAV